MSLFLKASTKQFIKISSWFSNEKGKGTVETLLTGTQVTEIAFNQNILPNNCSKTEWRNWNQLGQMRGKLSVL